MSECVLWAGYIDPQGYGRFGSKMAHKYIFEAERGAVPEGLQLDHLCRNRACVNVEHLEPVTAQVNTLRSTAFTADQARRTRCRNGHPFDEANTYRWRGHRVCRTCNNEASRRKRAKAHQGEGTDERG